MKIIDTVSMSSQSQFQAYVQAQLENGFKVSSSSCGYTPEPYDCEYWMAILVKEDKTNG